MRTYSFGSISNACFALVAHAMGWTTHLFEYDYPAQFTRELTSCAAIIIGWLDSPIVGVTKIGNTSKVTVTHVNRENTDPDIWTIVKTKTGWMIKGLDDVFADRDDALAGVLRIVWGD